ncbi:TPA: site-specific integrase, partial [Escherichia coli]|nr:site-specific integrase [Escherichia coli]
KECARLEFPPKYKVRLVPLTDISYRQMETWMATASRERVSKL